MAPDQVEDVVQESILDAWKCFVRGEVPDVEALKALVAAITRRRAVDLMRRLGAGRRDINVTKPLGDSEEQLPAPEPDGLSELDRREVGAMLSALMRTLSGEEERLLRSFYVDGLKQREIAEAFGIPLGTVGVTLDRARRKLREALRGNTDYFMGSLSASYLEVDPKELFLRLAQDGVPRNTPAAERMVRWEHREESGELGQGRGGEHWNTAMLREMLALLQDLREPGPAIPPKTAEAFEKQLEALSKESERPALE
jgi:RNA polymerase sigma-70 factor (ECF subfamily)